MLFGSSWGSLGPTWYVSQDASLDVENRSRDTSRDACPRPFEPCSWAHHGALWAPLVYRPPRKALARRRPKLAARAACASKAAFFCQQALADRVREGGPGPSADACECGSTHQRQGTHRGPGGQPVQQPPDQNVCASPLDGPCARPWHWSIPGAAARRPHFMGTTPPASRKGYRDDVHWQCPMSQRDWSPAFVCRHMPLSRRCTTHRSCTLMATAVPQLCFEAGIPPAKECAGATTFQACGSGRHAGSP